MRFAGYLLAGLMGALIGSVIPALHAQGYSPELREIHVNGVKVEPKDGVVNLQFQGGVFAFGGTNGTIMITSESR